MSLAFVVAVVTCRATSSVTLAAVTDAEPRSVIEARFAPTFGSSGLGQKFQMRRPNPTAISNGTTHLAAPAPAGAAALAVALARLAALSTVSRAPCAMEAR